MASAVTSPDLPRPIPVPRHNESIDTLRARLVYQTRKRGTLESDLILSTFAKDQLNLLTMQELREFDKVYLLHQFHNIELISATAPR